MQYNLNDKKIYNLEERTAVFAEKIVELCKIVPKSVITTPILSQLIRSGTSIGANYMEANGASSKKEARETKYWLRLLSKTEPSFDGKCMDLWQEAQELTLIFSKIGMNTVV